MVDPLRKELDKADWLQNPVPYVRFAAKSALRALRSLGIVDQATTFVARLAIIPILPPTRPTEDLFGGSYWLARLFSALLAACMRRELGNKPGNMEI